VTSVVTGARRLGWDGYCAAWATLHGGVDPRRSAWFVSGWLRFTYGVGRGLAAGRVSPTAVTVAGLALAAAVPLVVLPRGWWLWVAAGLVLLSAVADSADGAVAVITSRPTRLGHFYDSLADRLAEAAWLFGLWLVGAPGVLAVACAGLSWLHEYARARATVAGMAHIGVVTVAERPTRVVLTLLAFGLGGAVWYIDPNLTPGAITVVLAVWVLLSLLGGARLMTAIRAALAD